jgi:cytidylate kinase
MSLMDSKTKYANAVLDAKTRKKVVRIAKRERTTKAVMAGRLLERGLAEYERLLAEGKDPHQ